MATVAQAWMGQNADAGTEGQVRKRRCAAVTQADLTVFLTDCPDDQIWVRDAFHVGD